MRKLILVSATEAEIQPLQSTWAGLRTAEGVYRLGEVQVQVCITGVGMVNTALRLGMLKGQEVDLAINAGICGTFGEEPAGTVVNIRTDCFSEMGAQDDGNFLTLEQLGFGSEKVVPAHALKNKLLAALPQRDGVTVNTVHGHQPSIARLLERYPAQTESMEGAAFFAAANAMGWQCAQVRAISNKVEKRNRDSWNIPLAIRHLNEALFQLLQSI